MSMQRVSVIIPNYNHAAYLRQRIDTVLNQTYENFEVIILDDCSTDESRQVIETFSGHPRISSIVYNKTNSGSPFLQWQKGIESATGDWVWIAESDDYAEYDFLDKMMSSLEDHTNVGLVYCDSKIVTLEGVSPRTFASLKNKNFNTDRWDFNHVNAGTNELENYVLAQGTINNTSAVIFNKALFLKANPFDLNLKFIGDKYAFLKVLSISDVQYIKDSLNYFRDPFNRKHAGKEIFYFYEQFLVFNWVYRNIDTLNKKKFFEAFYLNTSNSLLRNWSTVKLKIYMHLFKVNSFLLFKTICYNIRRPLSVNTELPAG